MKLSDFTPKDYQFFRDLDYFQCGIKKNIRKRQYKNFEFGI